MTRTNSGVRWHHTIPIAVGLAFGIWLFSAAVPRLVTQLTGVEGTFQAERCTWEESSDAEWQALCRGSFTASDGSFTIPRIEAEGRFDTPPTEPIAAAVSGPSADKAVRPGFIASLAPMGLGLTAFAFPAVALTGLTRDLLDRRRRRADVTLEEPPATGAPAGPTAAHAAPVVLTPAPAPTPGPSPDPTPSPTPAHHD